MDIKAVVMDLDHTLLAEEFETNEKNIELFAKLRKNGYTSIICTARGYYEAYYFVEKYKPDYVICDNGAKIYSYVSGREEIIFKKPLDTHIVEDVFAKIKEYDNLYFIIENGEDIYYNSNEKVSAYVTLMEDFFYRTKLVYPQMNYYLIDSIKDVPYDKGIFRIYFNDFYDNEIIHTELEEFSKKHNDLKYISTFKKAYEFGMSDKGVGVKYLLGHLNLKKENAIAFGDSLADIPMFNEVAIGVSVANAKDGLKKISKYICDSVYDDGVANFLKDYLGLGEYESDKK